LVDDEKRNLMLKWCSYCQQFLGEVPDYEDLSITHGMCTGCHPKVLDFTESDFTRAKLLKGVQRKLFDAGRRNDLKAAEKIVEDAVRANIRPVDILIGIIAPLLYQIGEDWKKGILSVEEEHRFTAFCEKTFDLIAPKITGDMSANLTRSNETDVLLMNAPGNEHTLAIRILALWLVSKGMQAQIADAHLDLDQLVTLVRSARPKMLLISMALAAQRRDVIAIAERMAELPKSIRPKVIVGGYAVKLGLVPPIPGADLMADISSLSGHETDLVRRQT
jgi:methanogenic corrinoid protein MtbC1